MRGYTGRPEDLSKVEAFLYDIIKVPNLAERIECMLFKNKFGEDYRCLDGYLDTLSSAITGIRENQKIKEILILLLRIGNFMNHGTNKGKATGFKMALLGKLKDIKSFSGKAKMSMLDYVINCIRKSNKLDILTFPNDLKSCETASKIELSILDSKLSEMDQGL